MRGIEDNGANVDPRNLFFFLNFSWRPNLLYVDIEGSFFPPKQISDTRLMLMTVIAG